MHRTDRTDRIHRTYRIDRSAGRSLRTVTVAALLALGTSLASCSGSSDGSRHGVKPVTPDRLSWTAEQTIPGIRPDGIATDPTTGTTYIGGSLPASAKSTYSGPLIKGGSRKPVLWARDPQDAWHQVALRVTSFYGAQATFASLSSYGRLVALGAVAGGAHANPRPSFFVGSATQAAEREQNFYVYGGENAVGIVSVAAGPTTLLMVGQWAPDGHRASGALWTSPDGLRYVRHDQIPGLGDSAGGQVTTSPQAAAAIGDRFVVVGSVTDLTKPTLSVAPAVWSSDGRSVTAGSLPSPTGRYGGPTAIACAQSPARCLAAGSLTADGVATMAAWRIDATGTPTGQALDLGGCRAPDPAPDPGETTPRPARIRVSVDDHGDGWVVASTSRAGLACRVVGSTVKPVTVPAGCIPIAVQAAAGSSGRPELICANARGVTTYRQS
jgi:hypothetical protein